MKSMKLIVGLVLSFMIAPPVHAQFVKNKTQDIDINWQYLSPKKDNIYGIDLAAAYDQLKGMQPQKQVIVAIIGPGIDRGHENLKGALWVNPKEIDDGKDNDNNGKIDDLNGWNYLGNSAGRIIEDGMWFADREFERLKPKYEKIFPEGDKFYISREDETGMEEVKLEDPDEFRYYFYSVRPKSWLNSLLVSKYTDKLLRCFRYVYEQKMRALYPDQDDFSRKNLDAVTSAHTDTLENLATTYLQLTFAVLQTDSWNVVTKYMNKRKDRPESSEYLSQLKMTNLTDRELVGDDPLDINDTHYGNNILMAENAGIGTAFAGIIAANRSDGVGVDGITDNARIMTLRISPYVGEWIPKDLALSIRYAVDNKADIILMPDQVEMNFNKENKKWLESALEYAASKNVLVIQPLCQRSYDVDKELFSPNRTLVSGKELKNIITVSASDQVGNPLPDTDYGVKGLDVFAPGKDIYSPYMGKSYRLTTGSAMAGAVTAGIAALIKSYYPNLSAVQLREVLMNSVTDRTGAEVEKNFITIDETYGPKVDKDLFLFEDLCASKGIVNAAGAVAEAARISGSRR